MAQRGHDKRLDLLWEDHKETISLLDALDAKVAELKGAALLLTIGGQRQGIENRYPPRSACRRSRVDTTGSIVLNGRPSPRLRCLGRLDSLVGRVSRRRKPTSWTCRIPLR